MKKSHIYHVVFAILLCQFAALVASAQTALPVIAYISIDGTKTGQFKGNAVMEGNEGRIECLGFRYSVAVPHDAESGKSNGKRQHSPIVIIKNVDYSSPQFLHAAATNEILKSVIIEFYKKASDGRLVVYYRVTLRDASISQLSQYGGVASSDNGISLNGNTNMFEEISFTFQEIATENLIGNTSATEPWKD